MKRVLPVLLLLMAVMGVGWYALAASLRAEREYTALVDELARASGARILESRFERGLLRSRAETSLEVGGGSGFLFSSTLMALGAVDVRSRFGVQVVHEIEHGPLPVVEWVAAGCEGSPVLARIRSALEIDQESQLALAEAVGKLPPVEAETVVRTAGQALTTFWVPEESLRAKGRDFEREGRWLGLDGEIRFSEGFRHVSGTARSPGFEGRGEDRVVEARDLVWRIDLPGSELPVGRIAIEVGSLVFDYTSAGPRALALEGLELSAESKLAAGRYAGTLGVQVAAVRLGDEAWGPGSLRFALDDVDGHALRRLHRAALRLQSQQEGGDAGQIAVAAVDVLEALPQLLARGPRLALQHLQLATPAGPVSAHGQATLVAPDTTSGPLSLVSLVQSGVEAQLPAAVLDTMVDAKARSELTTEGADASDTAVFEAKVRERRDAHLAALREKAALVRDGATARLSFSLAAGTAGTPGAAEAPASTPAAAPTPPAGAEPAGAAERSPSAEMPVAEAPASAAKPAAEAASSAKPSEEAKPENAAPADAPAPKQADDLAQQPAAEPGRAPEAESAPKAAADAPAQPPAAPASEPAPASAP
jgi:uncharacterized protein YdgA (DUF945 family)